MKKLIYSQVMVSFISLVFFFIVRKLVDQATDALFVTATTAFCATVILVAFASVSTACAFAACAFALAFASAAFAFNYVSSVGTCIIFTIFALAFAAAVASENGLKWTQMAGACLVQAAVLYGIMVGVTFGFGVSQVVVPVAGSLAFAGVFLAPTAIEAIKTRWLFRP